MATPEPGAAERALLGLVRLRFVSGPCWNFDCHPVQTAPAIFPKHSAECLAARDALATPPAPDAALETP